MILTRTTMIAPLLDAHPALDAPWQAFRDEWEHLPPEEYPLYLFMGDLVGACSALLRRGDEAAVQAIFDVLETWLTQGDKYVTDCAIVGFIEDMQNTNLHGSGTRPDQFRRFLGPQGRIFWRKVDRFWSHGEIITDDRR